MKAVLRTFLQESIHKDELVDVNDESAFNDPYGDGVPFTVGSNQCILRLIDTDWREKRFRLLSDAKDFKFLKESEGQTAIIEHHLGIADPYRMVYYTDYERPLRIIIIPSSDDEDAYAWDCNTFEDAEELMGKREDSATMYTFHTRAEINAFIQGYEAAIGYLGDGMYFKNYDK